METTVICSFSLSNISGHAKRSICLTKFNCQPESLWNQCVLPGRGLHTGKRGVSAAFWSWRWTHKSLPHVRMIMYEKITRRFSRELNHTLDQFGRQCSKKLFAVADRCSFLNCHTLGPTQSNTHNKLDDATSYIWHDDIIGRLFINKSFGFPPSDLTLCRGQQTGVSEGNLNEQAQNLQGQWSQREEGGMRGSLQKKKNYRKDQFCLNLDKSPPTFGGFCILDSSICSIFKRNQPPVYFNTGNKSIYFMRLWMKSNQWMQGKVTHGSALQVPEMY